VKNEGFKTEGWEFVYDELRLYPWALKRPVEPNKERKYQRKYSILHQAVYWGNRQMIHDLLEEFGADINEKTRDDESVTDVVDFSIEERKLTDERMQEMMQLKQDLKERMENPTVKILKSA